MFWSRSINRFWIALASLGITACHAEAQWRAEVLPVELTVGYAVQAVDLSGDGKLDIAIVDSKRFIWLENPHWTVHVMHIDESAKYDNVCFAPHDIDGDGRIDFAVGRDWQFNNSDSGGHVGWLHSPADPRERWTYHSILEEPTTHRMRWIDWDRDGRKELVVAPLKGRASRPPGFDDQAVRLLLLTPSEAGREWKTKVLDASLHVSHNIDVVDLDRDGHDDLLAASYEGVTWFTNPSGQTESRRLASGQETAAPARGASEVRLGHLSGPNESKDQTHYLATIEPWHGDKVVVYTPPKVNDQLWTRHVIDEQLKWGHAVACANLDGDRDEELIIGVRDDLSGQHRAGVRIYDSVNAAEGKWQRTLLEPGQVAVEDLVAADLDGDGDIDLVAVGRATHNAVIYWNDQTPVTKE